MASQQTQRHRLDSSTGSSILTAALAKVAPCPTFRSGTGGKYLRTGAPRRRMPPPPHSNSMFHESRYKTELCRQYEELGECEYGERCLFAHGMDELKNIPHRHPKFKTEKCSAYYENGFCSFGPRCSFIHEKPDAVQILRRLQESVQKQFSGSCLNPCQSEVVTVVDRLTNEVSLIPSFGDKSRLPIFTRIAP